MRPTLPITQTLSSPSLPPCFPKRWTPYLFHLSIWFIVSLPPLGWELIEGRDFCLFCSCSRCCKEAETTGGRWEDTDTYQLENMALPFWPADQQSWRTQQTGGLAVNSYLVSCSKALVLAAPG